MKKHVLILLVFIFPMTARDTPNRIKGWLELNEIKQKVDGAIEKYNTMQTELKNETNLILQEGITAGDEVAAADPYAALVMYQTLKKLKDATHKTSLDIALVNKKFQELSDYIDLQYKELYTIRRKHLQFPF